MARAIAVESWPGLGLWLCALHEAPPPERQATLDAQEQARASRFVQAVHRRRYLAAHVALRERLAEASGRPAGNLRLGVDGHGKPRLDDDPALAFNLSHSDDWALIGLGRGPAIGVDIEVLRPLDDALALARRHYTPRERQAVEAAPDAAARERAFLRVWTRKEACLKAVGLGLRIAPSSFEAGAESGVARATLETPAGPVCVEVQSVETGIDAVAALARVRP